MENRVDAFLNDSRRKLRVMENSRVMWWIRGEENKGFGKVRNISASGMLLETKSNIRPPKDHYISFDTDLGQGNFIPRNGKLIWYRKKDYGNNHYLSGIEFINPGEFVNEKLQNRVQYRISKFASAKRIQNILSVLFFSGLVISLVALSVVSSDIYNNMKTTNQNMLATADLQAELTRKTADLYKQSELNFQQSELNFQQSELKVVQLSAEIKQSSGLYQENQLMLGIANSDLSSTQEILVQTEAMLAQLKDKNIFLKNEFDNFRILSELELAKLEEKKMRLSVELEDLNNKVSYYEGNINSIDEGRLLMQSYHSKMNLVKSKIKEFKKDAAKVRSLALNELDRVKTILGNNGYFMKQGKVVKVDTVSYDAVNLKSLNKKSNMRINVEMSN